MSGFPVPKTLSFEENGFHRVKVMGETMSFLYLLGGCAYENRSLSATDT